MNKIIILTVLLSGNILFAKALDTSAKAKATKASISSTVLSMVGVNGLGITGCNPKTGEFDITNNFVHCVVVYTETEEAYHALKVLLPTKTKIKDVYVEVEYLGEIVPQPTVGLGNK